MQFVQRAEPIREKLNFQFWGLTYLYQAKCKVPMAVHSHPHIRSHCPSWNVECLVGLTDNLSEPNIYILLDMSFHGTCIFLNRRHILKSHNCLGYFIWPKNCEILNSGGIYSVKSYIYDISRGISAGCESVRTSINIWLLSKIPKILMHQRRQVRFIILNMPKTNFVQVWL